MSSPIGLGDALEILKIIRKCYKKVRDQNDKIEDAMGKMNDVREDLVVVQERIGDEKSFVNSQGKSM